ncbi:Macrolide export ATP-binding/permease protein MacB [bioreactor metagenome]|uniref:Macrolide export ATP-binding/permease protein MacB n=1 Tax=bioreactor metagenome TaxID=1076179 RepID=A0A644YW06_9ZZZZ
MNILGNIKIALRALRANMLRSSLTVLGIVIGVAAVVALLSIGRGATANITDQVSSLGSNLITISTQMQFGPGGGSGNSTTLLYSDYESIQSSVSNIADIVPIYSAREQVASTNRTSNYTVSGVTPNYTDVRSYEIDQGRFLTEADYLANDEVAVVGSTVAEDLFEGLNALGRTIKINNRDFKIVGVLAESGSGGMTSGDDIILIPLSTGYSKIFGSSAMSNGKQTLSTIMISAASAETVDTVISDVELVLRSNHKLTLSEDLGFTVASQAQALETLSTVSSTLTAFLGAIAAISLLVGGIGIMNIMLVSVTERTREIGLRKAVGATQRVILTQFLIETMVLALLGGILGILLGVTIALIVTWLGLITAKITADVILLAFFSAALIGVFFGIYPAYQASKLRPIVALRYE